MWGMGSGWGRPGWHHRWTRRVWWQRRWHRWW